jgi:hypothetical protein
MMSGLWLLPVEEVVNAPLEHRHLNADEAAAGVDQQRPARTIPTWRG